MTLLEQANTLAQMGELQQAIALYDQVLIEDPQNATAWCNRGNPLHDLGQIEEALASFDRAIALNPNHYQSFCNKGVVLTDGQRERDALAAFDKCIALAPNFALAYSNRGNAYRGLHAYDLALADFVQATELDPALAIAHWNESTCRLHMGDYKLGWQKHEWRWQTPTLRNQTENTPRTTWQAGDPIKGNSITVWPEGGFGDSLQFTRFVYMLREQGARVSIGTPKPLLQLYQDSYKDFEVLPMYDGMPMPLSDYHISIMSLPWVCGITSLNKLTTTPMPYLFAGSTKNAIWAERLTALSERKLRIGLTWAGNPKTGSDLDRSLQFSHFKSLVCTQLPSAQFFSLQKGAASTQAAPATLIDFTADLHDWSDTAALINNLDLVITCDTANAHLAAAMGKPVWLLSRYNGCWRWLADRSDSPWYPTVRIFRQPTFGDWETVMQNVSHALAAQLHSP